MAVITSELKCVLICKYLNSSHAERCSEPPEIPPTNFGGKDCYFAVLSCCLAQRGLEPVFVHA